MAFEVSFRRAIVRTLATGKRGQLIGVDVLGECVVIVSSINVRLVARAFVEEHSTNETTGK